MIVKEGQIQQLEFISLSEDNNIVIGASNLVNSPNWTGYLWYFSSEKDVSPGCIHENKNCLEYPLPLSVAVGTFLNNGQILVGNDAGLVAIYAVDAEKENASENVSIYNKESRTEHDRSVLSLSTSKTNKKFLSSSMDCCVKLWDTETFMPIISYDQAHIDYVTFVKFVASITSGDVFISTSFDGTCLLWDCRKENPVQVLLQEQDYRPTHVTWFDDTENLLFVSCDYGTVKLIDTRNLKNSVLTHQFCSGRSVNSLCSFTHNSKKYLSVCGNTKTLKIYEYENKKELKEIYSNENHNDYIRNAVWLSKSRSLLSCSWDSTVLKHSPFESIGPRGDGHVMVQG